MIDQALRDPLRPLRVFWPFFAASAVCAAIAALTFGASIPSTGQRVLAHSDSSALVLPERD